MGFLILVLTLLVSAAGERPLQAQPLPQQEFSQAETALAHCRYGVTASEQQVYVVDEVGAGVFYRFTSPYWKSPPQELTDNNAELVRMIIVRQNKTPEGEYLPGFTTSVPLDASMAKVIRAFPGTLWLVGNEIERGPDPGKIFTLQGDIYPEEYAKAYHDIYTFIKTHDPRARVAIGAIIQPTPMRLQYLDIVWDTYQELYGKEMPVDVWNVHVYPLAEVESDGVTPNNIANVALGTDPSLGKREAVNAGECADRDVYCLAEHDDLDVVIEHVVAMRQWMKDKGQQQKPLIISEYGVVFAEWIGANGCYPADEFGNCFHSERVVDFLNESFDYFRTAEDPSLGYGLDNNRLVQQVVWFSAFHKYNAFRSNLLMKSGNLSPLGVAYRDYVSAEPKLLNLLVERVAADRKVVEDENGKYTARLSVEFRNNGDVAIDKPFRVTFYEDEDLTKVIGFVDYAGLVRGCATQPYRVEIDWQNLRPGKHPFWVVLDSTSKIAETPSNKLDNVGSAVAVVNPNLELYSLDVLVKDEAGGAVRIEPDRTTHPAGTTVTLEAVPFAGWAFSNWSGDIEGQNPTDSVLMNRDKSVTAHFVLVEHQLTVLKKGEGVVRVNPEKSYYGESERVVLEAVPAPGWAFLDWSGAADGSEARVVLFIESDTTVRARFVELVPGIAGQLYLPYLQVDR